MTPVQQMRSLFQSEIQIHTTATVFHFISTDTQTQSLLKTPACTDIALTHIKNEGGGARGGGTTKKSQAGKMHRNWVRLQSGFIVHAGQFHSSYVQVHYFLSIQLTVFSSSGSDNDKHSTQLCILRCLLTLSTPCLDLNA